MALVLVGALNILDGLSLPLSVMQRIRAVHNIAESLSAVGGSTQVILGVLMVIAGAGLLWRVVSAWILAVFVLAIAIAINVARAGSHLSLVLEATMLGALLLAKRRFTRRTALASLVFSLINIFAVLAYGLFGSFLLGSGFQPAIHDFNTAFYFTIVTLSTVGYGDIVPVSPEARWFVISLLVFGLSVFASAIASALGPKISGELNRLFNPKGKPMDLKEHVILVGDGAIARNTATELKRRGVAFIQIISSKSEAHAPGHEVFEGDATTDAVLRQAGIQRARMIIAASEDDGENAFIALGAKDLNPKVRVLAVASSAPSIRRLKLARADLVFSPAAVGSRLLADLVEGNPILPEFQDLLEGHAESD